MPLSSPRKHRQYGLIFELITQGRYVKVSAIDPRSGFEVCIVGDRRMTLHTLKLRAAQKLRYVQNKNQKQIKK